MTDALFELCDGGVRATELTRGPWDPDAQHGGPVAAILVRAMEALDDGGFGLHFARVTVELLKPVPLGALQVSAAVVRPGRRVQLLEASLRTSDGTEVTRARAVRVAPAPLDAGDRSEDQVPPFEVQRDGGFPSWGHPIFPGDGIEVRFARGSFAELGPATAWFRLKVPLVAGEQPSAMQRLMAAADFPNGIATEIPWEDWVFINPDLTVYVERLPVGEWIAVEAQMRVVNGHGAITQGILYDRHGRVGRATQSLFVAPR